MTIGLCLIIGATISILNKDEVLDVNKNTKKLLVVLLVCVALLIVAGAVLLGSGEKEPVIEDEPVIEVIEKEEPEVEYTDDYYSYLDSYIKDEATLRKYYRFIMNDYVFINKDYELVTNENYCSKEVCFVRYQEEEIENPKTNDSIYLYSSSLILIIFLIIKKYLVLSKHNKSFNNYSNI